ncbi:MAG: DUF1282 domain-containing protein [Aquificae bacterium]|nr:DUF1282 domain-containing protein [Aquificota bacterium]
MFKDFLELYLKPKQGWEKLAEKEFTIRELYLKIVVFFALIPAVSHFIGFVVFRDIYVSAVKKFLEMAENDPEQPARTVAYMKALMEELTDGDIREEFLIMLITYGFELLKPLVITVIIYFLAPAFGGIKDPAKAFTVAVFSLVPSWITGLFYVVNSPLSMFMVFLGMFYTFYLIFLGAEKVLKIPSEGSKNFQFIILVIILYLVISGVIGQVETLIVYRILNV